MVKFPYFLCVLLFLLSSEVKSQVSLNMEGELKKIRTVSFQNYFSEIFITADIKRSYQLASYTIGIHRVKINPGRVFYVYLKKDTNVIINYNIEKNNFKILNSIESNQLNFIDSVWVGEVRKLGRSRINGQLDHKNTINVFARLSELILEFENPEIVDWSTNILFSIEPRDSNIISKLYFMEFRDQIAKKFPDYNFIEFNSLLKSKLLAEKGNNWKN